MSSEPLKKIDLAQVVPHAVGLLAFDEHNNVIEASGIAKDRTADAVELSKVQLDGEGFGLVQEKDIKVIIYKQEGKTIAVYTYEK